MTTTQIIEGITPEGKGWFFKNTDYLFDDAQSHRIGKIVKGEFEEVLEGQFAQVAGRLGGVYFESECGQIKIKVTEGIRGFGYEAIAIQCTDAVLVLYKEKFAQPVIFERID